MRAFFRAVWSTAITIASASSDAESADGAANGGATPLKIMFVGDSITHGHEAAYTWRYRMWQWLRNESVSFEFVGPYTGTIAPMEPKPPKPPRPWEDPFRFESVDEYPRIEWGYATDIDKDFDPHHFATSGDRADKVNDKIEARIAEYQPDILLILLGVNDFAWGSATPESLLGHMKELIYNARKAKGAVKMAVANVIQRTLVNEVVAPYTDTYNELLKRALPEWSTEDSPLYYVDVASAYECGPQPTPCPAGFDGLHPNDLGEYQLASAFANSLIKDFSLGKNPIKTPNKLRKWDIPIPLNIKAEGTPMGTKVTWDRHFGITEFKIRERREGGDWNERQIGTNRSDTTFPTAGQKCEYQIRSCYGDECGDWPEYIASAVSQRDTAPPPRNIRLSGTELGFHVTWDPPEGDWNISSYEILFTNHGTGVELSVGSRRLWQTLEGNPAGQFSIVNMTIDVRMASWMGPGYGGVYTNVSETRFVKAGVVGTPEIPKGVLARYVNGTAASVSWDWSHDAVGHIVYLQKGGVRSTTHSVLSYGNDTLVAAERNDPNLEICVSAFNGELESHAICIAPPQRSLAPISEDYTQLFSRLAAFYFFTMGLTAFVVSRRHLPARIRLR